MSQTRNGLKQSPLDPASIVMDPEASEGLSPTLTVTIRHTGARPLHAGDARLQHEPEGGYVSLSC